jgi:rhamnose transport system permease protein
MKAKWVQGLPDRFQWFGLGQAGGQLLLVMSAAAILVAFAWSLRNMAIGRAIYATGSDREAARLCGVNPSAIDIPRIRHRWGIDRSRRAAELGPVL